MLDSTTSTTTSSQPRGINGRFLACNRLSPLARAQLAVELLNEQATVIKLRIRQVAGICRVSTSSIKAARTRNGHNGHHRKPVDLVLTSAWGRATREEQLQFIHTIGVEALWSAITAAL